MKLGREELEKLAAPQPEPPPEHELEWWEEPVEEATLDASSIPALLPAPKARIHFSGGLGLGRWPERGGGRFQGRGATKGVAWRLAAGEEQLRKPQAGGTGRGAYDVDHSRPRTAWLVKKARAPVVAEPEELCVAVNLLPRFAACGRTTSPTAS